MQHGRTYHGYTYHGYTYHGCTYHGYTYHGCTYQGGDVQHGVGGFGESVWGGEFEDESFALTHDARGEHMLYVYVCAHAHSPCTHHVLTMA